MHKCHLIYYKKRSEEKRKSQKALADKEFNNNKKLKTMNEEVSNTGAAFMEVSFKKIENQEKRIAAVEEKINNIPDNTQLFQKVISTIEGLK